MKFALISDVHGNLEALESVLRDIEKQGAEKMHFLGDAVGYGCSPNECVALITKHCDIKLLGNHDYAAMGLEAPENFNQLAQASMDWTQGELSDQTMAALTDFDMTVEFLDYFLVHASPANPDKWVYILDLSQAVNHFNDFSQEVCFIGHTHIPVCFIEDKDGAFSEQNKAAIKRAKDKRYIINIGSVGQPRDNDPRACYMLVDTKANKIIYRRVDYDIKKAQEKMKNANLPEFLIERIAIGV
jgi:diadenosine tetraphosphatase ApaH/serine/threonine PP2A family protein phosphatase